MSTIEMRRLSSTTHQFIHTPSILHPTTPLEVIEHDYLHTHDYGTFSLLWC